MLELFTKDPWPMFAGMSVGLLLAHLVCRALESEETELLQTADVQLTTDADAANSLRKYPQGGGR